MKDAYRERVLNARLKYMRKRLDLVRENIRDEEARCSRLLKTICATRMEMRELEVTEEQDE